MSRGTAWSKGCTSGTGHRALELTSICVPLGSRPIRHCQEELGHDARPSFAAVAAGGRKSFGYGHSHEMPQRYVNN